MYDKYTARPAVNIVFGVPAGYCVPVGINDIKILTF